MRKFLFFWITLLFLVSPALCAKVNSGNEEKNAPIDMEEKTPAFDLELSQAYLLEPKIETGNSRLTIAHYNNKQGLLAAYQSDTGKRIMFRARFRFGGGIATQIIHLDPVSGKIIQLIGKSRRSDENGQPIKDVEIAGVDIRSFMKRGQPKTDEHAQKESQLKQFATGDTGRALIDGVPALYALLETLEVEPSVSQLIEPFGAVAMALQLTTGEYPNFKNTDMAMGSARAFRLRASCNNYDVCLMRGKAFIVHRSGLFDILSKRRADHISNNEQVGRSAAQEAQLKSLLPPSLDLNVALPFANLTRRKDGNGVCDAPTRAGACFGLCGPGCINPGNISAPECYGHDYCVCAFGHGACLVTVPDGCGITQGQDCSSLWDAVGAYFGGLWDAFMDWIQSWFDDYEPCESGVLCQT